MQVQAWQYLSEAIQAALEAATLPVATVAVAALAVMAVPEIQSWLRARLDGRRPRRGTARGTAVTRSAA